MPTRADIRVTPRKETDAGVQAGVAAQDFACFSFSLCLFHFLIAVIKLNTIISFCSDVYSQGRSVSCFRPASSFLCSVRAQDVATESVSQDPAAPPVSVPRSQAVPKKPAAAKKGSTAKGKAKLGL